jgi:hypothetical protein
MRTSAVFGEILDRKLASDAVVLGATGFEPDHSRVPVFNPLFLKVGAVPVFNGDVCRATACFVYAVQGLPASRPARAARRLTTAQRTALDCLRDLGACTLPDDFTDAEAKRAFRLLARRYHPDRHPEADTAQRLHLAREFDRLTHAYRQLLSR